MQIVTVMYQHQSLSYRSSLLYKTYSATISMKRTLSKILIMKTIIKRFIKNLTLQ